MIQAKKRVIKFFDFSSKYSRLNARHIYFIFMAIQYFAITLIASNSAIFYMSHGISKAWLGYLGTISAIAILIFEFPTGIVADRFGAGLSVSISFILRGLGTLIAVISYGPLMFSIITLITSLGFTFFSGAAESWIFSKDKSIKKNIAEFYANSFIINGIARAVGGGIGTLLASVKPEIPFLISGSLLVMIALLFIIYNSISKNVNFAVASKTQKASFHAFVDDAKSTFQIILNDKSLFYVTFCGVFFIIFCGVPLIYWQPFFYESSGKINILGMIWLGITGLNITGNYVSRLDRIKQTTDTYLMSFLIFMCGSSLLVSAVLKNSIYSSILAFFVYQFFLGILGPVRGKFINQKIINEKRASVLSLISLLESTGSIITFSFIGYLCNFYDLKWIFMLSTIPLIIAFLFALQIPKNE